MGAETTIVEATLAIDEALLEVLWEEISDLLLNLRGEVISLTEIGQNPWEVME